MQNKKVAPLIIILILMAVVLLFLLNKNKIPVSVPPTTEPVSTQAEIITPETKTVSTPVLDNDTLFEDYLSSHKSDFEGADSSQIKLESTKVDRLYFIVLTSGHNSTSYIPVQKSNNKFKKVEGRMFYAGMGAMGGNLFSYDGEDGTFVQKSLIPTSETDFTCTKEIYTFSGSEFVKDSEKSYTSKTPDGCLE